MTYVITIEFRTVDNESALKVLQTAMAAVCDPNKTAFVQCNLENKDVNCAA